MVSDAVPSISSRAPDGRGSGADGGAGSCRLCAPSEAVIWEDHELRVLIGGPTGLPFAASVVPVGHLAAGEVDARLQRRIRKVLKTMEAALRDYAEVGEFEFCDIGPASPHLQVLAMARPATGDHGDTPAAFLHAMLPEVDPAVIAARGRAVAAALNGRRSPSRRSGVRPGGSGLGLRRVAPSTSATS
ncbi:hypothetical protein BH09ACT12_BH09ACT12_18160 [soil metagenome]